MFNLCLEDFKIHTNTKFLNLREVKYFLFTLKYKFSFLVKLLSMFKKIQERILRNNLQTYRNIMLHTNHRQTHLKTNLHSKYIFNINISHLKVT